jgi:hypothetical protein
VSLLLPRSKSLPAILLNLSTVLILELMTIKKAPKQGPFLLYGWGTRIRTLVGGVRVRSPAARRSPNMENVGRQPCLTNIFNV